MAPTNPKATDSRRQQRVTKRSKRSIEAAKRNDDLRGKLGALASRLEKVKVSSIAEMLDDVSITSGTSSAGEPEYSELDNNVLLTYLEDAYSEYLYDTDKSFADHAWLYAPAFLESVIDICCSRPVEEEFGAEDTVKKSLCHATMISKLSGPGPEPEPDWYQSIIDEVNSLTADCPLKSLCLELLDATETLLLELMPGEPEHAEEIIQTLKQTRTSLNSVPASRLGYGRL